MTSVESRSGRCPEMGSGPARRSAAQTTTRRSRDRRGLGKGHSGGRVRRGRAVDGPVVRRWLRRRRMPGHGGREGGIPALSLPACLDVTSRSVAAVYVQHLLVAYRPQGVRVWLAAAVRRSWSLPGHHGQETTADARRHRGSRRGQRPPAVGPARRHRTAEASGEFGMAIVGCLHQALADARRQDPAPLFPFDAFAPAQGPHQKCPAEHPAPTTCCSVRGAGPWPVAQPFYGAAGLLRRLRGPSARASKGPAASNRPGPRSRG